jgi:hypothetical protein
MAEKERITNPSMGSNEVGTETNEDRQSGGLSAGTDTQLNLAAAGGKKNKHDRENDDKNTNKKEANIDDTEFLEVDETDE